MLADRMEQSTNDNPCWVWLIDDSVNEFHLTKKVVHHVYVDNDNHVEVLIIHRRFLNKHRNQLSMEREDREEQLNN